MRKLFVLLVTLVALMLSTMIFSDAALGVQGTGQCGGATSQRCTTTTVKGNSTQANSSFTSSTTKHGNKTTVCKTNPGGSTKCTVQ